MTTSLKCAKKGCSNFVSYDRPLCYAHWKEFDCYELFECERCHWFYEGVYEPDISDEALCYECYDRERRGFPAAQVYVHAPIERRVRYLYIIKLDDGVFYVGQTNDLELRIKEHKDGRTKATAGKHPKLVWFEKWVGNQDELDAKEATFTKMAKTNHRTIMRMVIEWQRLFKLVDFEA